MESLIFICPKTDKPIDVGVETEIGTLLRIRKNIMRSRCNACGEVHEWQVRDAYLAEAA